MRQVSEKALEPIGTSKPAWKQLAELAATLGYDVRWSKLKEIRAELMGSAAAETAAASPAAMPAE
jgi:NADH dehydrogenase/NADH:ubiquinone oxidoreductase subunit G